MRHLPYVFAALALAGCNQAVPAKPTATPSAPATVATTNATVEPVPEGKAMSPTDAKPADCGLAKAKAFIGRQDRPTTRADLVKAVGHDRIRWLGPTMR